MMCENYMEIEELEEKVKYLSSILEKKKAYQKIPFIDRIETCLNIRAQQLIPLNKIGKELRELRFIFDEEEFKIWEKIFNKEMGGFLIISKKTSYVEVKK